MRWIFLSALIFVLGAMFISRSHENHSKAPARAGLDGRVQKRERDKTPHLTPQPASPRPAQPRANERTHASGQISQTGTGKGSGKVYIVLDGRWQCFFFATVCLRAANS